MLACRCIGNRIGLTIFVLLTLSQIYTLNAASSKFEPKFLLFGRLTPDQKENILNIAVESKDVPNANLVLSLIEKSIRNIFDDTDSSTTKTDATTRTVTKEPTDATTKSDTEESTDAVTKAETDEATDASTKAETDEATDAPTKADTDETTDTSTKSDTEKATDAPTKTDTDETTNAPTKADTNESTDVSTKSDTEKSTDSVTNAALKKFVASEVFTTYFVTDSLEEQRNFQLSKGVRVVVVKNGTPVGKTSMLEKWDDLQKEITQIAKDNGLDSFKVSNKDAPQFPIWGYILISVSSLLVVCVAGVASWWIIRRKNKNKEQLLSA